ncbi:MAG: DUF1559 domain-containing protein [Pirellulaceae bacterium]
MEESELTRPEGTLPSEVKTPQRRRSLLRHPVWGRVMFYGTSVAVIAILIFSLTPRHGGREAARRAQLQNQLKQIGLALLNYESHYGQFPPAYVPDDEGRPMHSWRVLILPYMDEEWHYEQYDFQKPWDDPENLKLLEAIPFCYRSPWDSNRDEPPLTTPCLAISEPGTILGTTEGAKRADISQDLAEIPVVIGNFQQPIPWTQPSDISPQQWVALHGWMVDNEKYPIVTIQADGSVRAVDLEEPPEDLARRSVIQRRLSDVP